MSDYHYICTYMENYDLKFSKLKETRINEYSNVFIACIDGL